jgi:hypothetical protein
MLVAKFLATHRRSLHFIHFEAAFSSKTKTFLPEMKTRSKTRLAAKIASTLQLLPWELIDEILVRVGNPKLAMKLKRFSIVRKMDIKNDYNWALANGHLEYLKYLNGRGLCVGEYKSYYLKNCAGNGNLNVLKYCHEHINPITECADVMDFAAACGQLELVKYLHSIGSKCTVDAMNWAASNGDLEIVKFLHENRQEGCSSKAMNLAAGIGNLEIVEFLYYNRKEGNAVTALNKARYNDRLDVVKFFIEVNGGDTENW